jgi:hypothetical protein
MDNITLSLTNKQSELVQDNLIQVITHGIVLLGVKHRMTHEALQIERRLFNVW